MAEAGSINFKQINSAMHAVNHASRSVPPTYLLPPEHSLGVVVVKDDAGQVANTLAQKMALASGQAKASKGYSPLWEGVLNLPDRAGQNADEYRKNCADKVLEFCEKYEAATGHKVLRADVHLDEGHMRDGEPIFNAHAHIMADRTNDAGRVIKLAPAQLRKIQDLSAEVMGLERGQDARKTGRKNISHHAYRYLAEKGRLEGQEEAKERYETGFAEGYMKGKARAKRDFDAELEQLKTTYDKERSDLKASGAATQADYMLLKRELKARTDELAAIKAAQEMPANAPKSPQNQKTGGEVGEGMDWSKKRLVAADLHDPYALKTHADVLGRAGIPPSLAKEIALLRLIAEKNDLNLAHFDAAAKARPEEFAAKARASASKGVQTRGDSQQNRDDGHSR